ncbi:biotin/lipoyl-binding carrier protein [Nocardioides sp. Kera G14]|uniref:biotin/lipoyl-binding carrier protein n=1 Tax=Nocardioides sp. Kera G14 TaxID=2884264 RepID=UPI001D12E0BC|nr:biotin/lipoyl-binding carrier protein [Nocardioides sp. Kera G14]UDY23339.1 biotin/lipoyl-binding carrier protein [Nocardioides sp. Kera G14]
MSSTSRGQRPVAAELVAVVLAVEVTEGQRVEAGETLVLLESMKMEIPVLAEAPGVVELVKVTPGDKVQDGDVLVVLA